jgi:hypothetical protein
MLGAPASAIMRNPFVFLLLVVACSCSNETASPDAAGGVAGMGGSAALGGGSGAPAGGSSAGVDVSSGGGGASTAGQAGQAGSGGTAGAAGSEATGGAAGAAGAGGSAGAPATFECSQLMGPNVAGEWFDAGFETAVGTAKWQVKAPHHSFVEDWANPNHDVWLDSGCQGTYSNCETKSKCEGAAVDRVLFVTQQGDYLNTPQATWESVINSAITTIKAKYPSLKHVDLLTFVRSPDGQNCGGETTVSPMLDAAHQAIAVASNGFVSVGPHLTASACSLFSGPPHMNAQGNTEIAGQLAEHYAQP